MAQKFCSEAFQPHITLAGVPDWPKERTAQEITQIANSTSPLELASKKVYCKNPPYQKMTLAVEKSTLMNSLHQKIDKHFEEEYSRRGYPHISLLYSVLPCIDLQQVIPEIEQNIPDKIFFDRIALVQCKGTPKDWRTLYTWKLDQM